jgi:mannan endo-1,4-beta-mannosidase
VKQSHLSGGVIAGCNFWGWAGLAEPSAEHDYWRKGDPYTADPAQEPQGLFSVFYGDSTVEIIRKYSETSTI